MEGTAYFRDAATDEVALEVVRSTGDGRFARVDWTQTQRRVE